MRVRHGTATLSATDVANHLSCRHLTILNFRPAKQEIAEPSWENPHLRVIQTAGDLDHEKAYIERLLPKDSLSLFFRMNRRIKRAKQRGQP